MVAISIVKRIPELSLCYCQASDPDSSSAGQVRYNITDGDVNTFYINPKSGQIWLRRTVYQDRRDYYTLTVSASDQDKREDTARVTVSIAYLILVKYTRYYIPQTVKTSLVVIHYIFKPKAITYLKLVMYTQYYILQTITWP